MTKAELRYEFEKIRKLDNRIKRECDSISDMRKQLYGYKAITYDSERVQGHGAVSNHIDAVLDKLSEKEGDINLLIDSLWELKQKCQKYIDMLSEDLKQEILYSRYFRYESMGAIAYRLSYTPENIYIIHNKALNEIVSQI